MEAGFYGYLQRSMAFDSLRNGNSDTLPGVLPVAIKLDKDAYRAFDRNGTIGVTDGNILFVDFDGVLTDRSCGMDYGASGNPKKYGISKECLEQLKRICDKTGSRVVISSNWRRVNPDGDKYGMPNPLPVLRNELGDLCVGFLPDCIGSRKPAAVREWLNNHPEFKGRFVIFDDYSREGFAESEFKDEFIKTDGRKGLTEEIATKAISMLSGDSQEKYGEAKLFNRDDLINRARSITEKKNKNEEGQVQTTFT